MARRGTSIARAVVTAALAAALAQATPARADTGGGEQGPEDKLSVKIAVWRFDALGIDAEIVQRLDTLFRNELDRLDKVPLPGRREVESKATAAEQNCTGEEKCLASIGKRLGVDLVVTGTVGSLGDNYVLNIKVVDVATGKSHQITSDPLRGSPDDLIEGIRVAAYRLLAPDQLHGSLQIQSDLVGASVSLDGKDLGKTPLANNGVIAKQTLGKHKLVVQAKSYDPFEQDIDIHFQKVAPVIVRLLPSNEVIGSGRTVTVERNRIYERPWFIVAAAVVVAGVVTLAAYHAGKPECYVNGVDMGKC